MEEFIGVMKKKGAPMMAHKRNRIAKGLTTIEIIGVAIAKEINAEAFYRIFAKKVSNRVVKRRILNMADEEAEHCEILKGMYLEMTGDKKVRINKNQIKRPEISKRLSKMSHVEVIKMAIEMEEESVNLYRNGYRNARNESERKILSYLIDFEKGHKETLTQELRILIKEPDWFDSAGSSEWLGQMFIGP